MESKTSTARWIEKEKRWKINIQRNGIRKSFYSSTKGRSGKKEAHCKAEDWIRSLTVDENILTSELVGEWLISIKMVTSKSNWKPIEGYLKNHILPIIGHFRIKDITEGDLQKVINYAYSEYDLSAKTLTHIKGILNSVIKYARKSRITELRIESLRIPRGAKKSKIKILKPEQIKILFNDSRTIYKNNEVDDWYINAYRFFITTGLRPGELVGLKFSDLDDGELIIRRSINIYGEVTDGKNKNAQRIFTLPKTALKILAEQKKLLKMNNIPLDYVFATSKGEQLNSKTLYYHWVKYQKAHGFEPISLYGLRHTFISLCYGVVDQTLLKEIVGHSGSMDTYGVYVHRFDDGRYKKNAEIINNVFKNLINMK